MMDKQFDNEGFLRNINDWDKAMALFIAEQEAIILTEAHWELIYAARRYFETFDISPEMRPFVKWLGQHLDKDKGRSLYLLTLFPGSPAKRIAKIAGLPKPPNCI